MAYSYDEYGNLISKTPTKQTGEQFSVGMIGYSYDGNGNRLMSAEPDQYDIENQLVKGPGGDVYGYDPSNKRV